MVAALAALAWGGAQLRTAAFGQAASAGQDVAAEQTYDEKTAKQFTQFQEEMRKGLDRAVEQIVKRYELDDDQAQAVRKLAQGRAEAFFKENALPMFDLRQRIQDVAQYVRQANGDWQSLPEDIRKDLYDRVMPMVDAGQKQLSAFSDDVLENVELTDAQRQKIQAEKKRMEWGFRMARLQARAMAGLPAEPGQDEAGSDAAGPGGNGARRGLGMGPRPLSGTAAWDAYVKDFIERYHLDEVQKLQANDILKKYKQRAEQLNASPASQPASQPTRTAEEFRVRLAKLAEQRKPMADLFEQLKAELDKIPTAVQKQLGDKAGGGQASPASGVAGAPAGGAASPGTPTEGPAKGDSAKPQE